MRTPYTLAAATGVAAALVLSGATIASAAPSNPGSSDSYEGYAYAYGQSTAESMALSDAYDYAVIGGYSQWQCSETSVSDQDAGEGYYDSTVWVSCSS